jgi:hypothetical protein
MPNTPRGDVGVRKLTPTYDLIGLAQSLRAQNRDDEAAQIEKEFEQAWKNADVKLAASRI